jgi:hypothetical protein
MTVHIRIQLLALEHFNWVFYHPLYSPHLIPSDYHLFTYLKNWLRLQRFNNNEESVEGVKTWLSQQAEDFFDTAYRNVFFDSTSASVLAVTMLRSSLSMYVFFINSSLEFTFRIALRFCLGRWYPSIND